MKVLVVDGARLSRALLCAALAGDDVELMELATPDDAPALVEQRPFDVVLIDLLGGREAALAAIAAIMQRRPTPILVLAATAEDWQDARDVGALDGMVRPAATAEAGAALRERVRWLARIPVVRHTRVRVITPELVAPVPSLRPRCPVVGIAASAGGSSAIAGVLAGLDPDFAGCIAIVQHLPVGFAAQFAALLRKHCALTVSVATQPTPARPGTVLVAPDDRHLEARGDGFALSDAPPCGRHRPSATVLFSSLARVHGGHAVGVILSGMGDDGVAGLAELRARGALTIAQDRDSAAVFGMPRAAAEAGAATRVLPVQSIAAALIAAIGTVAEPGSLK
jgi:two-component system chemotaxis response regulator CheB